MSFNNNVLLRGKHCRCGTAKSITHSECVFVALLIRHARRTRHTVICSLPCSTIFFSRYLISGTIFENKLRNIKRLFWFSLQHLSEIFLILMWHTRCIVINVHFSLFKVRVICEKYSHIKFHENPSSWSRVVPRGRKDRQTDRPTDRLADKMKQKVFFFFAILLTRLKKSDTYASYRRTNAEFRLSVRPRVHPQT
jgi:hypothetical protein